MARIVAEEKPEGTIFVIPVKLEEVGVPKRLSQWQWANLFEEGGYQRLVRALNVRAGTIGVGVSAREKAEQEKLERETAQSTEPKEDHIEKPPTPNPALPTKLISLRELFENDWPNLPGYYNVSTLESSAFQANKVTLSWRLNGDFVARSKFLAFFLESQTSPADALRACEVIANCYDQFIDSANSQVDISGQSPDDTSPTYLRDMVFSKRIFIYWSDPQR